MRSTSWLRVVGVGSPHGDDRLGWRVVERLGQRPMPEGLTFRVVSTPLDLIELAGGRGTLVVIDACRGLGPVGSVASLEPFELSQGPEGATSHGYGVGEALRLAEALGRLPSCVVILGIEAGSTVSGEAMSREVEVRFESIVDEVETRLRRLHFERSVAEMDVVSGLV